MDAISEADIKARIARDNPWWDQDNRGSLPEARFKRRVYLEPFRALALNYAVKRAAILLGPRRVGKTVMIKQIIYAAIESGIASDNILYASIDAPLYSNLSLESFLAYLPEKGLGKSQYLVVFDEIQYLKDWETHLKDLVDSYANVKFITAALYSENGTSRFT